MARTSTRDECDRESNVISSGQLHRVDTVAMDTWIGVQVVSDAQPDRVHGAIRGALRWFEAAERTASRFEPDSEVMRLAHTTGRPVAVSRLLLESVAFAL